jgi:hypothetical protein
MVRSQNVSGEDFAFLTRRIIGCECQRFV